jgi:hypothetical protein
MKQLFRHGLLLIMLTIGMACGMTAQSTQMVVTMNDGSVQTYSMMESGRVYFEDNTYLVIEEGTGKELVRILMSDIRKITCEEEVGLPENQAAEVSILPNPVHDVMVLHNLDGTQTVSIYAIDGRLMRKFETSGDEAIDVSTFPVGLYLVRTQSSTLKMIKL